DEPTLVAATRERGVGVYPVSPLFTGPPSRTRPRQAGLILGYASLTIEQIQKGVRTLAAAIAQVHVDDGT
ncbi:MAG TPA: PLP-dependent aminotransferase family protein, partial [Albitalea sp.]|nr:PLP-dependent aminotransferase family protein [Albitalea sp.]